MIGVPTLLFDALAGAAGFLAGLLSFVYSSMVDSVLETWKAVLKKRNKTLSPYASGAIKKLFLSNGLTTFVLLIVTVFLAVAQYWESLATFALSAGLLAYAWYAATDLLSISNLSRVNKYFGV